MAFDADRLLTMRRAITDLPKPRDRTRPVSPSPGTRGKRSRRCARPTTRSCCRTYRPVVPSAGCWGVPVGLTPALDDDQAIVVDFSTRSIGVGTRGPIHLQWNPHSKDTTNETVLRVEGRFAPAIGRPSAFIIADLSADKRPGTGRVSLPLTARYRWFPVRAAAAVPPYTEWESQDTQKRRSPAARVHPGRGSFLSVLGASLDGVGILNRFINCDCELPPQNGLLEDPKQNGGTNGEVLLTRQLELGQLRDCR